MVSGRSLRRVTRVEFEAMALPLVDPLYNFAHWISGDPDEAQDLVQETFARALKGLGGFREDSNFRAWMFRILRNAFLTSRTGLAHRNTVQEGEEGMADLAVDSNTPEVMLLRQADAELVRQALAMLPEPSRTVLVLADLEELSYREISEALGIPPGTVMSRLSRARAMLRRHLAARAAPGPVPAEAEGDK